MNFPDWTSFLPSYICHPFVFPGAQLVGLEQPRTEECSQTPPLLKTEFSSDQGDFRIVEENLAKIHIEGNKHRKTHWTAQEDRLLAELVEVRKLEWREISVHFPQRTQNMCYSRYRRISLGGKDRQWTPQDDQAASGWVGRLGEKWKLISARMPIHAEADPGEIPQLPASQHLQAGFQLRGRPRHLQIRPHPRQTLAPDGDHSPQQVRGLHQGQVLRQTPAPPRRPQPFPLISTHLVPIQNPQRTFNRQSPLLARFRLFLA